MTALSSKPINSSKVFFVVHRNSSHMTQCSVYVTAAIPVFYIILFKTLCKPVVFYFKNFSLSTLYRVTFIVPVLGRKLLDSCEEASTFHFLFTYEIALTFIISPPESTGIEQSQITEECEKLLIIVRNILKVLILVRNQKLTCFLRDANSSSALLGSTSILIQCVGVVILEWVRGVLCDLFMVEDFIFIRG